MVGGESTGACHPREVRHAQGSGLQGVPERPELAGEEEELLRASVQHAVDVHSHTDTPEFREQLRGLMKDDVPQHA